MLLNGSPFHSPVQLLMAFSSQRAAQLNQQEDFGQRKSAGKCLQYRGRCFSFMTNCSWANTGRSLVSGVYFCVSAALRGSRSELYFCKSGGTEACGPQNWRLHLTFNTTEWDHVATADYSDAAGDRGGRELCMMAPADGEMGSNKGGILAQLPLTDPACLCEFMATV